MLMSQREFFVVFVVQFRALLPFYCFSILAVFVVQFHPLLRFYCFSILAVFSFILPKMLDFIASLRSHQWSPDNGYILPVCQTRFRLKPAKTTGKKFHSVFHLTTALVDCKDLDSWHRLPCSRAEPQKARENLGLEKWYAAHQREKNYDMRCRTVSRNRARAEEGAGGGL